MYPAPALPNERQLLHKEGMKRRCNRQGSLNNGIRSNTTTEEPFPPFGVIIKYGSSAVNCILARRKGVALASNTPTLPEPFASTQELYIIRKYQDTAQAHAPKSSSPVLDIYWHFFHRRTSVIYHTSGISGGSTHCRLLVMKRGEDFSPKYYWLYFTR